ncbi:MAG: glycoside hydrolase family 28 protein [Prevotella sp.]|nr:glycoside hydrolase family 28 protein [Prevotella sp.]
MRHYLIFILLFSLLLKPSIGVAQIDFSKIPTISSVGASNMPKTISSTKETPFKMGKIKPPKILSKKVTFSINDLSEDGKITPKINEIIEELSSQGGGELIVPQGTWKSGRIILKSGVNLHLDEGAIIEFSDDIKDYQPPVFTRHEGIEIMGSGAFIYANNEKNIALTGEGKIMGPPMDSPMRTLPNGNSVVENDVPYTLEVEKRICDGLEGRTFYRPKAFSPINCENVLLEGITFEKSVLWNINPIYCKNVIIRGITVNSVGVPSGDGIDISSCKDVLIEYSTLSCGDDCFTLKAGRCEDGLRVGRPTENVLIRYCLAKEGHGGITCGSETAGGIKNVYLHDCIFDDTRTAFRFKTRRNRGGTTENILYENVRVRNMREAFTWDLLGTVEYMGDLALRDKPTSITPLTPTVKDITIRNFLVESTDRLITINGIPEIPCSNVLIENGIVRTNRIIRTMDDAQGITFRNLMIQATDNTVKIDNSSLITFEDVTLYVPHNTLNVEVLGDKATGIIVRKNGKEEIYGPGANAIK